MNRKGCIVENTGQSREKCTVCLVWTQESDNKRDVKSNCEAILPLIFAGFTRVLGIKKRAMGTLCISNYHMHVIYQHGKASNEYIRIGIIPFVFVIKYQCSQITQTQI